MKIQVALLILLFITNKFSALAQNHRTDRYDGPINGEFGLKAICFGALIWLIGMIIIKLHKSNERGSVNNPNAPTVLFGVILAVIGGLSFFLGLIALGF